MTREIPYAIGIIHYRDPESVWSLVRSIRDWTHQPKCIYVADNSAKTMPFENPEQTSDFRVLVLDMDGNVGYGPAANRLALAAASDGYERLLLLTQDALLRREAAHHLLQHMEESTSYAVCAPALFFASKPEVVFSLGGHLTPHGRTLHPHQGKDRASSSRESAPYSADWVDGACMLLRLSAFHEVGGFDPAYFLYVEEVDLHMKLRLAGYSIEVVPEAQANQEPGNYSLYYKYRNLSYFHQKFRAQMRPWPWQIAMIKDSIRMLRRGKASEILGAFLGLRDYAQQRMGPRPLGRSSRNAQQGETS